MSGANMSSIFDFTINAYNKMDGELFGTLSRDAKNWNVSGGHRVQNMFDTVVAYIEKRKLDKINILNMSGLLHGKPDPVLYDLLVQRFPRLETTWTVIDHPESATMRDATIRRWVDQRGIRTVAQDFRAEGTVPEGRADVVICTEILEHLDYSNTIRLLRNCRAALRPGGMVLLTTPNATYVLHRIMFALGQWDFLHHMDSPEDVDRGLLGHIMYYDGKRLSRLLASLDFTAIRGTTFNAGHGPGEYRNILTRFSAMALRLASKVLPQSGQVLLVTAERPV